MASSSQNRAATATRGGASSIPTPANSGVTSFFGGFGAGSPTNLPNTHKSTSVDEGQRRLSQSQGSGKFGNLHSLKRGSQDMGTTARKQSMSDQTAKPGVIGSMWSAFTSGSPK